MSERKMIAQNVAQRITEARTEKGLSMYELAKLSGVHYANLYRIEKCDLCPRIDTLYRICDALQIQIVFPFPI